MTYEQAVDKALEYMVGQYGRPLDGMDDEQRDRWHERLGLLTHFLSWFYEEQQ